jgi:pilus assembly protein CpaC
MKLLFIVLLISMTSAQALASAVEVSGGKIMLTVFQSETVTMPKPASRVSVADPDIADVVVLSPSEFYILGKDVGVTNALVWDRDGGARTSFQIEVTHDLNGLKSRLHRLIPGQSIEVSSAQRSIVLSGSVPNAAAMITALRIAESYLARVGTGRGSREPSNESREGRRDSGRSAGEVINLLEIAGAQQVMVEVRVAEIARSEVKRMNARFNAFGSNGSWSGGGVNGGASFPNAVFSPSQLRVPSLLPEGGAIAAPVLSEFLPNTLSIANQGIFTSYLSDSFVFNLALDAAKENGLAKILAEPTLTTLTGQEATFLSGGEFPIPVPQSDRSVTIAFKDFGVALKVLPTVLSGDRINTKLEVSVSEISNLTNVVLNPAQTNSTFVVPSLTRRNATGTVELADGQTIALAGLFSDNVRSLVTKFPGLGSVPVLGALFRSQEFLKGNTELVILVTPRLAKPVDMRRLELPTDRYREPNDWDFYMLGRLVSLEPPVIPPAPALPAPASPAAASSAANPSSDQTIVGNLEP